MYIRVCFSFLLLLGVVGCNASENNTPEQEIEVKKGVVAQSQPDLSLLKERSMSRWKAMIKKDFDAAYDFFSPEYRKLFSRKSFKDGLGNSANWREAEIEEVDVNGMKGTVNAKLGYTPIIPSMPLDDDFLIPVTLKEVWLWDGANWWYVDQGKKGV